MRLLISGNTEKWDTTLLRHALLYSSQFLIAKKCGPVQLERFNKDKETALTGSPIPRHILLCFHKEHELIRKTVKRKEKKDMYVASKDKNVKKEQVDRVDLKGLPSSATEAVVYECTEEWLSIESLTDIRNKYFAHHDSASIKSTKLNEIADKVKRKCRKLVGDTKTDEMLTSLSGMATSLKCHLYFPWVWILWKAPVIFRGRSLLGGLDRLLYSCIIQRQFPGKKIG